MQEHQVHWYRGLFLRPQHFQAQDRYWREQFTVSLDWLNAYGYGLVAFAYDSDALAAGTLRITLLKARLRDGTLVSIDTTAGDAPLDVDIKRWMRENEATTARAFLAVPKLAADRSNISAEDENARFHPISARFADENADAPKEMIDLRRIRVHLLVLKPADKSDRAFDNRFELLGVGQFRLTAADSPDPTRDEQFAPALLAMNGWPGMHWQFLREVHDRVSDQRDRIAAALGPIQFGSDELSLREMRRLWLLDRLNSAKTDLFIAANARMIHPFQVYTKLAEIVGELSIFAYDLRAAEIPAYDHDDPKPGFLELAERIYELMKDDISLLRADFRSDDGETMFVQLDERWFHPECDWYLGVHRTGVTDAQLLELEEDWFWDQWLFQTREHVTKYNQKQAGLLQKKRPERVDPELPAQRQWSFYQIDQEASLAWKDIAQERELAMKPWEALRVASDRIYFQVDGRPREFRFALFGVRNRRT